MVFNLLLLRSTTTGSTCSRINAATGRNGCVPSVIRIILVLFFLSTTFLSSEAARSVSSSECQVMNALGEDVTAAYLIPTNNDNNNDNNNNNDDHNMDPKSHVLCQADAHCQDFTISNCQAVKCIGSEACYQTTMTNIGALVQCHEVHSCHRAIVHFAEDDDETNSNGDTRIPPHQSMTCQGEGACNVAEIQGSKLQLECFGRKACRKINAVVDVVHCTHGQEYSEACTEHARLQANCILCGYQGCESHVNHCGTKPIDATEEDRWQACLPHQAIGTGCTPLQIQALETEIATDGQVMTFQESQDVQKETIQDNGGSN